MLSLSCARMLLEDLALWLGSQTVLLSFGIAFRNNCQMIGQAGARTWTQTWIDQWVVKVLSALKSPNKMCGLNFCEVCWRCQNWGKQVHFFTLIPRMVCSVLWNHLHTGKGTYKAVLVWFCCWSLILLDLKYNLVMKKISTYKYKSTDLNQWFCNSRRFAAEITSI